MCRKKAGVKHIQPDDEKESKHNNGFFGAKAGTLDHLRVFSAQR